MYKGDNVMMTLENNAVYDFPLDFPRSKKKYPKEEKIAKILSLSQNVTGAEKEELDRVSAIIDNSVEAKMSEFARLCNSSTNKSIGENLKDRYGSITEALIGILPQVEDYQAEKERALTEKYENFY